MIPLSCWNCHSFTRMSGSVNLVSLLQWSFASRIISISSLIELSQMSKSVPMCHTDGSVFQSRLKEYSWSKLGYREKHTSGVTSVASSSQGSLLHNGCDDGWICLYKVVLGRWVSSLTDHSALVTFVCFHRDIFCWKVVLVVLQKVLGRKHHFLRLSKTLSAIFPLSGWSQAKLSIWLPSLSAIMTFGAM